jgi:hypothetical protein
LDLPQLILAPNPYDTGYFYGMLVSACRNIAIKSIVKHVDDQDGIMAWEELKRDFDNDGSKTLRMETLEDTISKTYYSGGLAAYLDKRLTAFHELAKTILKSLPSPLSSRSAHTKYSFLVFSTPK